MITKKPFGTAYGHDVTLYTLTNASGASVSILDHGGIINAISVPGADGKLVDVALGYDRAEYYEPNYGYLGALIGRFGNRIAKGAFALNGKKYQLARNSNGHHLHGGDVGFDRKLWKASVDGEALTLEYVSPDGEEGYPGEVRVKVTYVFTDKNELKLRYQATTDADTPLNLTNHCYFNLDGEGSGDILGHTMKIDADYITECDAELIPTGKILPVDGTPFDLRAGKRVGDGVAYVGKDDLMTNGGGYDHNFIANGKGLRNIATVTAEKSGVVMDVFTDLPAVQFYCGNMIDCVKPGKAGKVYKKRWGLCLETQYYPDNVNHANFPSCVLKAGDTFDSQTIYAFSAK